MASYPSSMAKAWYQMERISWNTKSHANSCLFDTGAIVHQSREIQLKAQGSFLGLEVHAHGTEVRGKTSSITTIEPSSSITAHCAVHSPYLRKTLLSGYGTKIKY
ncbi:unnamed protein product [Durusdinium trenchii]|uniref:Uncharacterized protein n=1 Tax=Durusdinium trenchii TaxID=1381693 RepID=A0ABP0K841_9DINO